MITDEDPLRGLLFCWDLGFSHALHVLKERRRRREHPHLREKGSPVPAGPPIFDDADTGAGGPRRQSMRSNDDGQTVVKRSRSDDSQIWDLIVVFRVRVLPRLVLMLMRPSLPVRFRHCIR